MEKEAAKEYLTELQTRKKIRKMQRNGRDVNERNTSALSFLSFYGCVRRKSSELDCRTDLFNARQKVFNILLLVENQIGELLIPMEKVQPVIEIRRRIVRLAHGIAAERSLNIIIGAVIFDSEIIVVHTFFTEPYPAFHFSGAVVCVVKLVTQLGKGSVRSFKLEYAIGK